ncbi:transporter substrate-binding domain-containing protein [Ferruginivarius sediminum]|uniref:Glutamine ABC transporter substrate-binding protein GlnH n=1 Tax=Ferruginivarius sediminum TaxID=2661937 RepID=A0A369T9E6_9PROT|nr:transporter substrate-binding domain-containing protein [Ferruginivarius sediminum]RDD60797.1 glutamine ABC transporter substrate-binding protein GlnH [Ferruginivarius sediminum]
MKRVLTSVLAAAALLVAGTAVAQDKITVATDTNFKPFSFKNDEGNYVGFDIDMWQAIAEKMDADYELRPMDFNGIIPGLQTGNVDVAVAGMSVTAKREKVIDFSYPYYKAGLVIMVRADNSDIGKLEDLSGKVVATKQGTSTIPFLKENIEAGVLDPTEIKKYPNITDAFLELRAGGTDAVIFDLPPLADYANGVGKDAVKLVGPLYMGHHYGIGFPAGSELRDPVNVAILELKESGEYDKIYKKWFGSEPK